MCEEFFMLGVTHSQVDVETEFGVVSLILIDIFINFSFDKKRNFSILQVSRNGELTASVRHFTLCGIL